MARTGRPGSIRGEAQARGVSEYQIRKEREIEKALAQGREPSLARAAGKKSNQRRRDLYRLKKAARLVADGGPEKLRSGRYDFDQLWRDTKVTYDLVGVTLTEELLAEKGITTSHYLKGETPFTQFHWRLLLNTKTSYPGIPDSMFWYHGGLG